MTTPFRLLFLLLLIVFIGVPMWLIGLLRGGRQPDNRFLDWIERKLTPDA